jgi:hypothetical protein
MIVAGKGCVAQPDAHMIHSNILLGELLHRLYTAWPSVPWYGGYMILVHFFSQTALLYCAISLGYTRTRLAIYLLYFALVALALLNTMQFTTTAFLATQAGIFLFCLAWRRRQCEPQSPVAGTLGAAIALFLLGFLVRSESFYLALTISAPIAWMLLRQGTRASLAPVGGALALGFALVALAYAYNYHAYQSDPVWRDFLQRDELRKKFNDYTWTSYSPKTAAAFEAAGWSQNDHELIVNWNYEDPVVFTEANIRTVLTSHPWRTTRLERAFSLHNWKALLSDRSVIAFLLALPNVLILVDPRGQGRFAVLVSLAMALFLILAITLYCKVPPTRVYLPIMSFPLAVAVLYAGPGLSRARTQPPGRDEREQPPAAAQLAPGWRWIPLPATRGGAVILALLLVAMAMSTYKQVRRSVQARQRHQEVLTWLEYARPNRDKLHVIWGDPLPLESTSPLDSLDAWAEVRFLSLAWMNWTPFNEQIKRDHGFTRLGEALCHRDDIILVALPRHIQLYQKFMAEHFGVETEFVASQPEPPRRQSGWFKPRDSITSRPEKALR